jgi:uncharacterized protein
VISDISFLSHGLVIAGNLYVPDDRIPGERYPAVVVSHPFGGVKEQAAGLYARRLCAAGFVTLAFDAGYQGESEGEPRFLESPWARVEDVRCAVTCLSTLQQVDPERIGALGICASGGYVPHAAQTDRRIKAVATVSAADIGLLFREGLGGGRSPGALREMLAQAGAARIEEALGDPPRMAHIVPPTPQDAEGAATLYSEGYEYYRTPRGEHPNSQNWYVFRSVDEIAQYSSYELAHLISPHPLLLIAGTGADTAYFSEIAYEKAREPKELFPIGGATHIDLYDKEEYVPIALARLADFFGEHLGVAERHLTAA